MASDEEESVAEGELSRIIVSGTVDAVSSDRVLIVNAESIHVEKP